MRSDLLKYCVCGLAIAVLGLVPAAGAQQQKVPAGTSITVSLDKSVSSKDAQTGQKLVGRVATAVVVGGKTLIQKGAKVNLSVASVRMAGPMSAPAKLLLQIDSIEVNRKTLTASSNMAGQGDPQAQRDAANRSAMKSGPGALIDGSNGDKGELFGASARSSANAESGGAGDRQKDITLSAQTKLRFMLRTEVQLK